jgi:hypothetical protein
MGRVCLETVCTTEAGGDRRRDTTQCCGYPKGAGLIEEIATTAPNTALTRHLCGDLQHRRAVGGYRAGVDNALEHKISGTDRWIGRRRDQG